MTISDYRYPDQPKSINQNPTTKIQQPTTHEHNKD